MLNAAQVFLIVGVASILRLATTYHPYSGENNPPMYGDYEAQRHWQEITINLPINHWYTNSTSNDLNYWGLDYPPLTAYHSFLLGKIAENFVEPQSVKLTESRGYESETHRHFMRLSVYVVDVLIYFTSIFAFFYAPGALIDPEREVEPVLGLTRRQLVVLTALVYPGMILIDHGHFQYNCVSLGLFILAVTFIHRNRLSLASFFFVLALNYKQMELYHALPFFFYILGYCWPRTGQKKSLLTCLRMLISVALTVVVTFVLVWAPFIQTQKNFLHVLSRLFPVARGVFEDKVANFWCAVNIFIKLKRIFTNEQLAGFCAIITSLVVAPSCLNIFLKPTRDKFLLALINSSMAFYLFSFQVHEKSILLVAVPVVLFFPRDPLVSFWFLVISTLSLIPLLVRDGLFIAYAGLMVFYAVFCSFSVDFSGHFVAPHATRVTPKVGKKLKGREVEKLSIVFFLTAFKSVRERISGVKMIVFYVSMVGVVLLSFAPFFKAPSRYPDLVSLAISVYCFLHFCGFFVYFGILQLKPWNNRKFFKSKIH